MNERILRQEALASQSSFGSPQPQNRESILASGPNRALQDALNAGRLMEERRQKQYQRKKSRAQQFINL